MQVEIDRPQADGARAGGDARWLASQIGFRLRFAHGAVWKDLLQTFRPFGLRPQHYAALVMIVDRPGITQQDLSVAMGLHGSNLVTLLDGLTKPGFVERRQIESDRRFNGLHRSVSGATLLDEMNAAHRQHEERIAALFSPHEQAELVTLLRRLETIDQVQT